MSRNLYIIGNGFDLHHNLKTRYYDFANYLENSNSELYDALEAYVKYPDNDDDLWWQFESNLAKLDANQILSEYNDRLPDYLSDDYKDRDKYVFPDIMQNYLRLLTSDLIEEFTKFIQEVEYPKSAKENIVEADIDSVFLTFNYTRTLEHLYGIDKTKILYVHNSAFYGGGEIVLGHGVSPENFEDKLPELPDDVDIEDYEKWYAENDPSFTGDYSYDNGKDTIWQYFKSTFKPTESIIEKNSAFFNSLKQIQEIYVFGHSISKIDLPYFEKVVKSTSENITWNVSYYNSSERKKHLVTLKNIGIAERNIKFLKLNDIQKSNKQLKLLL